MDIQQEAVRHVEKLAGEIGPRMIGTPGCKAAAAYITELFNQAGMEVEYQPFPCPNWQALSASLTVGGETFATFANTWSPSCDVEAPTVPINSMDELERTEITGRIPIFFGHMAEGVIAAKGAIYVSPRDRRIHEILEQRQPAALITITPTLHGVWRITEDFDLDLPSATVQAPVGLRLLQTAPQPAHLTINTFREPSDSGNLIARLPGRRRERIVVCAHYDSKVDTPGAYDNAAGVAALLVLARLLTQDGVPPASLEFIAISGEEVYGLGDMTYHRAYGDTFDQIIAAINMDGIGPWVASNTIATFAASEAFEALVYDIKTRYPGVVRVDPWPASDHYIFYSNGVPSVALSSIHIEDLIHDPADTAEWISPARLGEAIGLAADLVKALLDRPVEWGRKVSNQDGKPG